MEPKLSITVVTYNHKEYVAACLDSILAQKVNFTYEIIVSDDCSIDGTVDIIREYFAGNSNVIMPLFHDRRIGAIDNFIAANLLCKGEYIAHIDGDDLMLPGKLQKQVDFLDQNPDCAIVCHNLRVFEDRTGETLYYFNDRYKKDISTIDDLIMYGTFFGHSSKMFRRSALPEEGIDHATKYIGDWLFHIQNARKGKIGYIDEVLGEWRRHKSSLAHHNSKHKLKALADLIYTLQKAAAYTSNDYALKYGYARVYSIYAYHYFKNRNFKEFGRSTLNIYRNGIFAPVIRDFLHYHLYFSTAHNVIQKIKRIINRKTNVQ